MCQSYVDRTRINLGYNFAPPVHSFLKKKIIARCYSSHIPTPYIAFPLACFNHLRASVLVLSNFRLSRGFGYHQHRPPPGSRAVNGGLGLKVGTTGNGIDTIDSSLSAVVTPNAYHHPQHQQLQQQQRDPASASLLPKGGSSDPDERFNNNLFGQFKGFSISPLQREAIRPAPSVPNGLVAIKTNPQQRAPVGNGTLPRRNRPSSPEAAPPALPPPNVGSTARPLISSPVLSTTTCTSLELKNGQQQQQEVVVVPSRSAPAPPPTAASLMPPPPPPLNHPETSIPSVTTITPSTSTLNRIASMLSPISGKVRSATNSPSYSGTSNNQQYQHEKETRERRVHPNYSSHSLPRNSQHKANKIADRELLRSLEISNPIPQREIELASPTIPVGPHHQAQPGDDESCTKSKLPMRAQSMRAGKTTARPAIHTFGSMRSPRRPASLAASACRPSSPPPPVPPSQSPPQQQYDDCMNLTKITEESPTTFSPIAPSLDNIYAVIEEPVPEKLRATRVAPAPPSSAVYKTPRPLGSQPTPPVTTAATEVGPSADSSLGLLSEIVSEISSRNLESIYSSKSLSPELPAYANTPGIYSNSSESDANRPDLVSSCSSRLRRPGAPGSLPTTAKSPDVLAGGRTATTSTTVPSVKPVAPPKSSLVAAMQLKFERNDEA
ncbi:hypothetical protein QAD02_022557 [Eretmocerus hayati]|uniref:Uncharacterized protein n=1 Tax=Eretmocerus hayati TaxID=131215 RepID=A0ACC2PUG8_9HYME|nr:hypothetical protein QAD02_022557 [Eretmocerus hayati]